MGSDDLRERGRIKEPHGVWFDRYAVGHELPEASVVELRLSFGGMTQVSALPDNTGYLVRVFPPGGTHEEGGDNRTDLSFVLRYDEGLQPVIEGLHLWNPMPLSGRLAAPSSSEGVGDG